MRKWTKNLYEVYSHMKMRCYNKNHRAYKDYGARGITISDDFDSVDKFCEWAIDNGYKKGLQIDRKDNDLGYSKANCHFISAKENSGVGKRRMSTKNSSGFEGVTYEKQKNKWRARIKYNGNDKSLGNHKTKIEAVLARIDYEINELGGQLTNLSVISG